MMLGAISDHYVATGGGGDPYALPSVTGTLLYDHNAADLALSDGASVASWAGRVGPTLTASGTAQPTYRTSVTQFGSKPGVDFDGSDDLIEAALASSYTGNATLFAVFTLTSVAAIGTMVSTHASVANLTFQIEIPATGNLRVNATTSSGGTTVKDSSATPAVINTRYIMAVRCDGSGLQVKLSTDGSWSTSASGIPTALVSRVKLGQRRQGGNPGNGKIARVCCYDSALSDTDAGTVFTALASMYA